MAPRDQNCASPRRASDLHAQSIRDKAVAIRPAKEQRDQQMRSCRCRHGERNQPNKAEIAQTTGTFQLSRRFASDGLRLRGAWAKEGNALPEQLSTFVHENDRILISGKNCSLASDPATFDQSILHSAIPASSIFEGQIIAVLRSNAADKPHIQFF
jgi:hypothetical protein